MMKKKTKIVPMKKFKISLIVELDEDQIWPNGDGPTYPDQDDVQHELRKWKGNILVDWHLMNDLEVEEI